MKMEERDSKKQRLASKTCPYLDTIQKQYLDFDFEKVCSISLAQDHIYACLVCGKYFAGRGPGTHAYTHSLQASHHVFINLETEAIYCLPENYRVDTLEAHTASLSWVSQALHPTFSASQIAALDSNKSFSTDAFGVSYLPGFVGLNNLSKTDYVSVVIQALGHVSPLRNHFLKQIIDKSNNDDAVITSVRNLLRRMWSPWNIKSTISPHELLQQVSVASKKRFSIGTQNEALDFTKWLLNKMHYNEKKKKGSIVHDVFQGHVTVHTTSEVPNRVVQTEEKTVPFLLLSLDLPPSPLFKDSQGSNVIPQIPLYAVLEKFNGRKVTHGLKGSVRTKKTYKITTLPSYLILHVARFTKNNFFVEKNPTIVSFPIKNLDMAEFVESNEENLLNMSISELKKLAKSLKVSTKNIVEKQELISVIEKERKRTKYDLVANICHDSSEDQDKEAMKNTDPLAEGSYRVHVQNAETEQWYEISDLSVTETMPQLIGQSESYMMIYKIQ